MMAGVIYLGDELGAAGYRLAGAQVRSPRPGAEPAALAWACAQGPSVALVLVSAAVAAAIAALDEGLLRDAVSALRPAVLVVPDVVGDVAPPDLAARLRGQLGMQA